MRSLILPPQFFRRPVLEVAPELLGKYLVCGKKQAMIIEVEAYDGPTDLACHASRGRTPRTEVMFAPGGVWYVYLVYGMHWMLNVVTGPADYPAAVLIRGIQGAVGPGRLTKHFGIDKRFNGLPAGPETGLYVAAPALPVSGPFDIIQTPRIGIAYAGPVWQAKPWRFVLDLTKK